jgi:hypothetical protein
MKKHSKKKSKVNKKEDKEGNKKVMASKRGYPKYYKYKNPDPSTAKYAPIIVDEILKIILEIISKNVRSIYHIRPESVLGIDLKHAVMRELSNRLDFVVAEIDSFEKENANDLRNYPWTEDDEANLAKG